MSFTNQFDGTNPNGLPNLEEVNTNPTVNFDYHSPLKGGSIFNETNTTNKSKLELKYGRANIAVANKTNQ